MATYSGKEAIFSCAFHFPENEQFQGQKLMLRGTFQPSGGMQDQVDMQQCS